MTCRAAGKTAARVSSSSGPAQVIIAKFLSSHAPRLFKSSKVDTRSERVIGPVTSSIRLAQVLGTAASLVHSATPSEITRSR